MNVISNGRGASNLLNIMQNYPTTTESQSMKIGIEVSLKKFFYSRATHEFITIGFNYTLEQKEYIIQHFP